MEREPMPGDLQISILLAASTLIFTLVPPFSDLPVRIPLGLAMVLFVPGYALIAALFPKRGDLDGIERVALSFGLSIATVPLIGLGLNYTPWGIRLAPIAISLAIFTIAMSLIAYFRRSSLPEGDRFSVGFRRGLHTLKQEVMTENASRLDKALTVILIISILVSVTALAYVIVMPKQGEKFTEFYILGPEGKAYDYPTQVALGNSSMVIVGVVNHEYSKVNYTMQLEFHNSTILQRNLTLEHNATWERPVNYSLAHQGDEQKLEFFLYKENNFTAPYRDLHLWVNVSGRGEEKPEENLTSESKAGKTTLLRSGEGDGNKKRKSSQVAAYNRTDSGEESKKIPSHEEIKFSLDKIQNRLNSLTEEPETTSVGGDTEPQAAHEAAQGSSGAKEPEEAVQSSDQTHQPAEETSSTSSAAEEEEKAGSETTVEETRAESTKAKAESETSGSSSSEEKASTTKAEESTTRGESPSEGSQASEETSTQASGQADVQSPKSPDKPSTSSISMPRKPVALGSGAKKMVDLG